jgi:hypothetical protein
LCRIGLRVFGWVPTGRSFLSYILDGKLYSHVYIIYYIVWCCHCIYKMWSSSVMYICICYMIVIYIV